MWEIAENVDSGFDGLLRIHVDFDIILFKIVIGTAGSPQQTNNIVWIVSNALVLKYSLNMHKTIWQNLS